MSSSQPTPTTTRMFARVLGPLLSITCITALVRSPNMRAVLSDFAANALWPWVTGALVLASGLIVVALHQLWRGAAAVIVSLLGWLMVLRGVVLMAFPATFVSMANSVVDMGALWRGVCIVLAAIGLYLTYVGWAPEARPHEVNDHARPAPA